MQAWLVYPQNKNPTAVPGNYFGFGGGLTSLIPDGELKAKIIPYSFHSYGLFILWVSSLMQAWLVYPQNKNPTAVPGNYFVFGGGLTSSIPMGELQSQNNPLLVSLVWSFIWGFPRSCKHGSSHPQIKIPWLCPGIILSLAERGILTPIIKHINIFFMYLN